MTVTMNGVVTLEIAEGSHVFWVDAEAASGGEEGEHFVDWVELTQAQRDHWNHLRDTLSGTIQACSQSCAKGHLTNVSREAA